MHEKGEILLLRAELGDADRDVPSVCPGSEGENKVTVELRRSSARRFLPPLGRGVSVMSVVILFFSFFGPQCGLGTGTLSRLVKVALYLLTLS